MNPPFVEMAAQIVLAGFASALRFGPDPGPLPNPGNADVLVCDSLLPRLEADAVAPFLAELRRRAIPVLFVIPLTYSPDTGPDQRNLHRTVESAGWWMDQIRPLFADATPLLPNSDRVLLVSSWKADDRVLAQIAAASKLSPVRHATQVLGRQTHLLWRLLSGTLLDEQQLFADLAGKSLAVVGNARSLSARDLGARIDGHDRVLRFNAAPLPSAFSHGQRTDLLATSTLLDRDFLAARQIGTVLWMSQFRRKMGQDILGFPRLYVFPARRYAEIVAETSRRPSTGAMVLSLLRHSRVKKVEIFGFDFFRSESNSGHQTAASTPHAYSAEEIWVRDSLLKDERFALCP